jgi:hypothetical protein
VVRELERDPKALREVIFNMAKGHSEWVYAEVAGKKKRFRPKEYRPKGAWAHRNAG